MPSTALTLPLPPASSPSGRTTPPTAGPGDDCLHLFAGAGAGVNDPVVVAETFTTTDPRRPSMPPFTTTADAAASAGAITSAEAVSWLAELAHAGTSGCVFWAVTMFAVGGVRHSPNGAICAKKEEDQ
jgi:hypothetical protein